MRVDVVIVALIAGIVALAVWAARKPRPKLQAKGQPRRGERGATTDSDGGPGEEKPPK